MLMFIKAVSDTVLDMINAIYHDKPLISIGATYREKLVPHHRAVHEADCCLHTMRGSSKLRHKQGHRTSFVDAEGI